VIVPDVSYSQLFHTGVSYPAFLKRVRVGYLELGLGLELMLVLEFRVRAKVRVKVRARLETPGGTKRLGTKMLG